MLIYQQNVIYARRNSFQSEPKLVKYLKSPAITSCIVEKARILLLFDAAASLFNMDVVGHILLKCGQVCSFYVFSGSLVSDVL